MAGETTVRSLVTKLGFKIEGESEAKKYDETFKKLKETAIKFVEVVGVIEIGKKMIEAAAGNEQMRISFEAFTGSAEKASVLMEKIAKYSMSTGINKDALEESAKSMMAMGIGSDKIMGNLQIIGNLSAGLGKDKIPMLTEAFAKMNDRGLVNARSFMQLQASGVPIMETLRKQMGLNTQQLMQMGQAGALKYADMEKALLSLTTGNGKFANLAMKQATSLNGIWERGKMVLTEYAERIGTTLLPSLEGLGNGILNALVGNMDEVIASISKGVNFILYWIGYLFGSFKKMGGMDVLKQTFASISKALSDFFKTFTESGGLNLALTGLKDLLFVLQGLAVVIDVVAKGLSLISGHSDKQAAFLAWQQAGDAVRTDPKNKQKQQALKDAYDEYARQDTGESKALYKKHEMMLAADEDLDKNIANIEKRKAAQSAFLAYNNELSAEGKQTISMDSNSALARVYALQKGTGMAMKTNPMSGSKNTETNNNYNINSKITVQVPQGTPAAQQQEVADFVKKAVKDQWNENIREFSTNTQRTAFAGVPK